MIKKILSLIKGSMFELFSALKKSYLGVNNFSKSLPWMGYIAAPISLFLNFAIFSGIFLITYFTYILPDTGEIAYNKVAGQNISVTFLDRNGIELGQRGIRFNDSLPFEEYPDHLIKAIIATEDRRFYEHIGVDILGTFRAIIANIDAKGIVQGGSTITQQLVKNLFLSPERTLIRKIREAVLSLWLESKLEKNEIMKLYLDRSYMGAGVYGVVEASRSYFNKDIQDMTLVEAALIAGVLKAPSKYAPHVSKKEALIRTKDVIINMYEAGFITKSRAIKAIKNLKKLDLIDTIDKTQKADFYLDWLFNKIKDKLDNSGYNIVTIRTTLDINMQNNAEQVLNDMIEKNGDKYKVREGAIVTMSNEGEVLAMVGGRDYSKSQFNRAVSAKRQPGSAFKPIAYLAALNNGYTPNTIMIDQPYKIGDWEPKNYTNKYRGIVSLTDALTFSINTIAVAIVKRFGLKPIIDTGVKLGLEVEPYPSSVLGTSLVSLIDLTRAYGVFANKGIRAEPYGVLGVYNVDGKMIEGLSDKKKLVRVFEGDKVNQLDNMLSQVVDRGTGRRAKIGFLDGLAGKTGTTQDYRDAWFLGYSDKFVTGVWFGNDNFEPTKKMTGGSLPAKSWKEVMSFAHKEGVYGISNQAIASNQFMDGEFVSIKTSDLFTKTYGNKAVASKTKLTQGTASMVVRNVDRKKTKIANRLHSHFLNAIRR